MDYRSILVRYIDTHLEYMSKSFQNEFKKRYNISGHQMSSIWYLRKTPNLTMTELANKLNISKQQVTKLVDSLVNKNLVKRKYPASNRRVILLNLTEYALEVIEDVEKVYTENFISILQTKDKEEIDCLFESMNNISNILMKNKENK